MKSRAPAITLLSRAPGLLGVRGSEVRGFDQRVESQPIDDLEHSFGWGVGLRGRDVLVKSAGAELAGKLLNLGAVVRFARGRRPPRFLVVHRIFAPFLDAVPHSRKIPRQFSVQFLEVLGAAIPP
jgi:hypothetical protein